eukprot:SAG31_NODE_1790_length_7264_cov_3.356455_6_plen_55_part_00
MQNVSASAIGRNISYLVAHGNYKTVDALSAHKSIIYFPFLRLRLRLRRCNTVDG